MPSPHVPDAPPGRSKRTGPVLLALRLYGRELARHKWLTAGAMLLPAVGNTGINYVAPLVVAKLVGRIADDNGLGLHSALPYVLGFAGALLLAELMWRLGLHCLNRLAAR
ncbi:ABC transporter ATP-binding protein, partial [Streptomyces sp. C1-2]|nr:ABC transporter ATP-binding protein [Streptomyces sp. C1-2]